MSSFYHIPRAEAPRKGLHKPQGVTDLTLGGGHRLATTLRSLLQSGVFEAEEDYEIGVSQAGRLPLSIVERSPSSERVWAFRVVTRYI